MLEITISSKTVSLGFREVKFNKSELLFVALDNNNDTFLLGGKGQLKVCKKRRSTCEREVTNWLNAADRGGHDACAYVLHVGDYQLMQQKGGCI